MFFTAFVTSSNPSVGSTCIGLGVSPHCVGEIVGIIKAYCTRVGEGPFPTELHGKAGDELRESGGEFGTTTGRPRRCGWLDIPQLRYSLMLNGVTDVNLTKLDVLSGLDEIKVGVAYHSRTPFGGKSTEIVGMPASLASYSAVEVEYETLPGWTEDISKCKRFSDLPVNCQAYVLRLEKLLGRRIRWIGVGAGREAIIDRFPTI